MLFRQSQFSRAVVVSVLSRCLHLLSIFLDSFIVEAFVSEEAENGSPVDVGHLLGPWWIRGDSGSPTATRNRISSERTSIDFLEASRGRRVVREDGSR